MKHVGRHRFRDRTAAGRELADALGHLVPERPLVLALPRGGVPVAHEVARTLRAPLDVWVVRKVGVPWQPELGMGAVAEGGRVYLSPDIVARAGLSRAELGEIVAARRREVEERVRRFRGGRPPPDVAGRTVILVDDGIATGGTVRAAIRSLRTEQPRRLVLAVPVAALDTVKDLEPEVDELVVLQTPADLTAIGLWYEDFEQVPDEQVSDLLEHAHRALLAAAPPRAPGRAADGDGGADVES